MTKSKATPTRVAIPMAGAVHRERPRMFRRRGVWRAAFGGSCAASATRQRERRVGVVSKRSAARRYSRQGWRGRASPVNRIEARVLPSSEQELNRCWGVCSTEQKL